MVAIAAVIASVVVPTAPAAIADTAPAATVPATVSSDPLPAPQLGNGLSDAKGDLQGSGVVWDQVVVGDTVYVGGAFTFARPAGAGKGERVVERGNFLAYNLKTGALLDTSISFNSAVRSLTVSPDQKTVYAAGSFSEVNGQARYRVAAIDVATGKLVESFVPFFNATVNDVAVSDTTVYAVGIFGTANDVARKSFAAVDRATGKQTLPWAPQAGTGPRTTRIEGRSVILSPTGDKVVVAGRFDTMNGSGDPGRGMAALDPVTAQSMPWKVNSIIRNGTDQTTVMDLTSDGDSVYAAAYKMGALQGDTWTEGTFRASWADGTVEWLADCHGDSYSVMPFRGAVYTASHAHSCRNVRGFQEGTKSIGVSHHYHHALAFSQKATGTLLPWTASTDRTNFGGQPSPTLLDWYPDFTPGAFTGSTQAAWDITASGDYVLYGGEFSSVNGVKQRGLVRFAVRDVAPNADGPRLAGAEMVPTATALGYGAVRLAWKANADRDNAHLTYEIERTGAGVTKIVGTMTRASNFWTRPSLTFLDTGLAAKTDYAYRIRTVDPLGNATWGDRVTVRNEGAAALKTTAYDRGILQDQPIAYWPLSETGGAKGHDFAGTNDHGLRGATRGVSGPHQGMTATAFAGTVRSWASTAAATSIPRVYASELWFSTTSKRGGSLLGVSPVVGATSPGADRQVYLDDAGRITYGVQRTTGTVASLTSAAGYNDGKWHHVVTRLGVGGLELFVDGKRVGHMASMKPNQAKVLSGFWNIGGHVNTWGKRGSSDYLAGSVSNVAIYAAGLPAARIVAHHAQGLAPVNTAPKAAFTSTVNGGAVSVSAASSVDSDGSVESYAWDFGDGTTGTGSDAQHAYARSGTYTVTLTVRDDGGATGTTSAPVTVTLPPDGTVAMDDFARSVSSAWGTARVGGGWTTAGGASAFSVRDGGAFIAAAAGASRSATLGKVSTAASDARVSFSIAEAPTGGGQFVSLIGRQVGSDTYTARVKVLAEGTLQVQILRSGTTIRAVNLAGMAYTAGETVNLRVQVSGSGTSTVAAKAWTGATEPDAWQATITDSTPALQTPGAVGLGFYVSASGAASTATFRDFSVTALD